MKREHVNPPDVQKRRSAKDKNSAQDSRNSKRPQPSDNPSNPDRGLNQDDQKRRTNQDEADEITNAHKDSTRSQTTRRDEQHIGGEEVRTDRDNAYSEDKR